MIVNNYVSFHNWPIFFLDISVMSSRNKISHMIGLVTLHNLYLVQMYHEVSWLLRLVGWGLSQLSQL